MGAGGRDFHTFNILFRNNEEYDVVAFTAAQIPGIAGRKYPSSLAGKLYSNGIPIYDEKDIGKLIKEHQVKEVILAYSDLLYEDVMSKASIVLAAGASFKLLSPFETMLKSTKPVIAVTASRTGAGKSTISKKISEVLLKKKIKFTVIRHPMAYSDLEKLKVVKLKDLNDLDRLNLSIEEKEEFENYLKRKIVCFEGIDYKEVLNEAEKEFDLLLWDGGNNDLPFIKPDLMITAVDPIRVGHEKSYPGEINVRLADVLIITKVNTAERDKVIQTKENIRKLNTKAEIIEAEFIIEAEDPSLIKNKRVLVVEDGPTVTHGHLPYGAGFVAAKLYGAKEIVDPRDYATGIYKKIYSEYPHMDKVLPTIGYNEEQLKAIEEIINRIECDTVILGTQSDLSRYLKINKNVTRVYYEYREKDSKNRLEEILEGFLKKFKLF
jgi:predicted GTPase